MTELDTEAAAAIKQILDELGKEVTLHRTTKNYDPVSGKDTGVDSSESVIITPPQVETVENDDRTTKSIWTFYSGPVDTISDGCWFNIDNKNLAVVKASPVYSGELICLWKYICEWALTITTS